MVTNHEQSRKHERRFQKNVNLAFRKILCSKTTIFRKKSIFFEMERKLCHVQGSDITFTIMRVKQVPCNLQYFGIFLEHLTAESKPSEANNFENQSQMLVELATAAYHMAEESFTEEDYIIDVPGTFIIGHYKTLFLIIYLVIQLRKRFIN